MALDNSLRMMNVPQGKAVENKRALIKRCRHPACMHHNVVDNPGKHLQIEGEIENPQLKILFSPVYFSRKDNLPRQRRIYVFVAREILFSAQNRLAGLPVCAYARVHTKHQISKRNGEAKIGKCHVKKVAKISHGLTLA